jgi:NADPH-dependent ferric siderophore reductase
MDVDSSGGRPQGSSELGRAGGGEGGRGGGRRRQPPQLVSVVSVSQVGPRLVAVHVKGGDLTRFGTAAPTSHIKVFLPLPGQDAPSLPVLAPQERSWPENAPRPIVRTYTPRSYDAAAGTLEVQFALHGAGLAAEWALRAKAGDKIAIGGPGGRFAVDLNTRQWWIAGDESALPAVGTLLDALPATATAEVHLEVADADDEIPLESAARTTITWHHRRRPDAWGAELHTAAVNAAIVPGTQVWVACEASAMRRIRRQLTDEQRVPASAMVTRGYWRLGVADHPDHDYGEE